MKSLSFSFKQGLLSVTQMLGIVTLIPKGDKNKSFHKNWGPLTVLNSLYKMVNRVIAERIRSVLENIIHSDQKGFVADRYIGEAIRTTYDTIQWAKDNNIEGLLLLIDFEKAYGSVSFSFIEKSLRFFNFGENIIKLVNILPLREHQ